MSLLFQVLKDAFTRPIGQSRLPASPVNQPVPATSPTSTSPGMPPSARTVNPLIDYLERHPHGRQLSRWNHYFDIYHRHFARLRGTRFTMIEIGIFNGGSLPMWRDYFGPQVTVVGVDINAECSKFAEPGIEIVIGDQSDRSFLAALGGRYRDIGVVLDDGGHQMHQQIATFEELYPLMRPDGVYLCEDTHSSYLPLFGGGYRREGTFIEMAKGLIDKLTAAHSVERDALAVDQFTRSTDSLHFYDSVVVIEKRDRPQPREVTYGSVAEFKYVAPSVTGRS